MAADRPGGAGKSPPPMTVGSLDPSADGCPIPAPPGGAGNSLSVTLRVRLVGGEAGRAIAAAQGRALAALLASLAEAEVGQGEEVSP
jgi:hypothetical protein